METSQFRCINGTSRAPQKLSFLVHRRNRVIRPQSHKLDLAWDGREIPGNSASRGLAPLERSADRGIAPGGIAECLQFTGTRMPGVSVGEFLKSWHAGSTVLENPFCRSCLCSQRVCQQACAYVTLGSGSTSGFWNRLWFTASARGRRLQPR